MPPRYVDILVVHCGGNDLQGTPRAAEQLVDDYICKFLPLARVAVICSVVTGTDLEECLVVSFDNLPTHLTFV